MSRYIDADALIAKMPTVMDMQDTYLPIHFKEWLIDTAPSIDVVRCKECKFWIGHISDDDGFDEGLDECRWRDSEAPDADDFCSFGERKNDAD